MKITVLIPCYNEEKTIKKCINSCLRQTRAPDQIVVVNDGSTDASLKILKSFKKKIEIVDLIKNTGNKSRAQEAGLKQVTGDIFVTTDADTLVDSNFIYEIEKNLMDPKVSAVAGYVKSLKHNWLTALRELDYVITQKIHKTAQSYLGAILVIPGCAAAYRTKDYKETITFDHDTVTEDLDFTYKFHESGKKIVFNKKAIVYTQDPADLTSYIKQIKRWYGGGWQNLIKHQKLLEKGSNALELTLVYGEGLTFSALTILLPFISWGAFKIFLLPYFVISLMFGLYAALTDKRIDILIYSPFYVVLSVLNSWLFLTTFFKEIVLRKNNMVWLRPERRVI